MRHFLSRPRCWRLACLGEAQRDPPVARPLDVGAAEEIGATALAEALEVGLVEDDVGLVAAGGALEAVEANHPARPLVDAVALAPVEDRPLVVRLDARGGQALRRPIDDAAPALLLDRQDRPQAELGDLALVVDAEDHLQRLVVADDHRVPAGSDVRRGPRQVGRLEPSPDRSHDLVRAHCGASSQTSPGLPTRSTRSATLGPMSRADGAGQGKRILVVKTGEPVPKIAEKRGQFADLIAGSIGELFTGDYAVVDARTEEPPSPRGADAVVITGSAANVPTREGWMLRTEAWLREVVAVGTLVFGICFGHQILAQALGGEVQRNPRGREIGTVAVEQTASDPIFDGLPATFAANVTHIDTVVRLPPGGRPRPVPARGLPRHPLHPDLLRRPVPPRDRRRGHARLRGDAARNPCFRGVRRRRDAGGGGRGRPGATHPPELRGSLPD